LLLLPSSRRAGVVYAATATCTNSYRNRLRSNAQHDILNATSVIPPCEFPCKMKRPQIRDQLQNTQFKVGVTARAHLKAEAKDAMKPSEPLNESMRAVESLSPSELEQFTALSTALIREIHTIPSQRSLHRYRLLSASVKRRIDGTIPPTAGRGEAGTPHLVAFWYFLASACAHFVAICIQVKRPRLSAV
jgi:hypothetical protein